MNKYQKGSDFFKPPTKARKLAAEAFVVSHYAGDVCYEGKGGSWLEKNNDSLPAELQAELAGASMPLLRALFDADETLESGTPTAKPGLARGGGAAGKRRGGAAFNSISRRFINNLNNLTTDLGATEAHFIRCIKPNAAQQPALFEQKLVLEQLRGSGVFDAVELMKAVRAPTHPKIVSARSSPRLDPHRGPVSPPRLRRPSRRASRTRTSTASTRRCCPPSWWDSCRPPPSARSSRSRATWGAPTTRSASRASSCGRARVRAVQLEPPQP